MQISSASQQLTQNLNKLNQLQMQMQDKVQNFNGKMLKASVATQVETQVAASKAESLNLLA